MFRRFGLCFPVLSGLSCFCVLAACGQYKAALTMGYTRPLPELYEAAGIRFDFSPAYVKELGDFVMGEIKAL